MESNRNHRLEVSAPVKFAGFPVRQDGSQRRAQQYSWNAEGTEMGFVGPIVPVGAKGRIMDRQAHHTMNGGGSTYTVVFDVPGHGQVRLNGMNASDLIA